MRNSYKPGTLFVLPNKYQITFVTILEPDTSTKGSEVRIACVTGLPGRASTMYEERWPKAHLKQHFECKGVNPELKKSLLDKFK